MGKITVAHEILTRTNKRASIKLLIYYLMQNSQKSNGTPTVLYLISQKLADISYFN